MKKMMSGDNDQKTEKMKRAQFRIVKSDSDRPIFGQPTTQMMRSAAYEMLEAYGVDEHYDSGDYTSLVDGLEKIQLFNSFVALRVPELRDNIKEEGLFNIKPTIVQRLKWLLSALQRDETTKYQPEFCELCYRHRDARSAKYCLVHKPLAEDKKAYLNGQQSLDDFLDNVISKYNTALDAKKFPSGLDMVFPKGFNYPNIVKLLSGFPLSQDRLLPVVHACRISATPLSCFDVLAKIYDEALDPNGVELVRRMADDDNETFRCLQDLMHFVVRYEAYLSIKNAASKKRGPKVQYNPNKIRKMAAAGKTPTKIHKQLGCSRATVYQALRIQCP